MKTAVLLTAAVGALELLAGPAPVPVLREYEGTALRRIALPLGGIGTGTISLGGRGELADWQLVNEPSVGFTPAGHYLDAPGFLLYVKAADGAGELRALEGPMSDDEYFDGAGFPAKHGGFPRFAKARFLASYPSATVELEDPALPVSASVTGFNPFIPGDSEASSLPIVELVYRVRNLTDSPVEAAVCGHLRNFVGVDPDDTERPRFDWTGSLVRYRGAATNRNEKCGSDGLKGVRCFSKGVDPKSIAYGTFALTTPEDGGEITSRTSFSHRVWYAAAEDLAEDFGADGSLDAPSPDPGDENDPMAALAVRRTLPPRGTAEFRFYLTWSFPNRYDWHRREIVGNHYTTIYPDAWEAARRIVPRLPDLARRTRAFTEAFLGCDAPAELKEAALFNLSTLRSPTVFRIPSGHLLGWEGVFDWAGSCEGSCTHVWNYEQATAYLFGDLARTMRDVEFNYSTDAEGKMEFRTQLPLDPKRAKGERAADGQMGAVLKAFREWRLSGDRTFLASVWPGVKRALAYAWTAKRNPAWDADGDGVMEGPQGNTMDVEYWGPNPQMGFWYLGALRAGEEMAKAMDDADFAKVCAGRFASGRKRLDELCFNGEYYEQKIPEAKREVDFQLGAGCLVDQLVGQTFARQTGLGELGVSAHLRAAIESVAKYNHVADHGKAFNPLRMYAGAGEAGLVMASWPRGRQRNPFPYYSEAMTGFEYAAASELYWQGLDDLALRTVRDVRARHNGVRRNPYSEPECGHHYARAMASWGTYLAWSGFGYDAVTGEMRFAANRGRVFWSTGSAWGTANLRSKPVRILVAEGHPVLKTVLICGQSVRYEL